MYIPEAQFNKFEAQKIRKLIQSYCTGKDSINVIPLPLVCFCDDVPDFGRAAEICCA
jgi:hypothetical protein